MTVSVLKIGDINTNKMHKDRYWQNNDKAYTICEEMAEKGALTLVLGGDKDWVWKVTIPINFKEWLRICHIKWALRAYLALKF